MMNVRKRNSILAHASPRIKRRALVGAGVMPTFKKLINNSIRDGYNPRQVHCCSSSRCGLCPKLNTGSTFKSSLTGWEYLVICNSHLSCDSKQLSIWFPVVNVGFNTWERRRNYSDVVLTNIGRAFENLILPPWLRNTLRPRATLSTIS